ncbi:hypothetical protein J6590_074829 [Homalodisca vitripennis]|nr:hypothetical protein J6590_074829 [Homalodisca vitripennis]
MKTQHGEVQTMDRRKEGADGTVENLGVILCKHECWNMVAKYVEKILRAKKVTLDRVQLISKIKEKQNESMNKAQTKGLARSIGKIISRLNQEKEDYVLVGMPAGNTCWNHSWFACKTKRSCSNA